MNEINKIPNLTCLDIIAEFEIDKLYFDLFFKKKDLKEFSFRGLFEPYFDWTKLDQILSFQNLHTIGFQVIGSIEKNIDALNIYLN